jgi:hypothetical protein
LLLLIDGGEKKKSTKRPLHPVYESGGQYYLNNFITRIFTSEDSRLYEQF